MLYGLVAHTLWYAPIYGWLLLVSAWARKAPFLWAVLPVFAAFVFEKIVFGTSHVATLDASTGSRARCARRSRPMRGRCRSSMLSQLDPVAVRSSPGLWSGLVVRGGFASGGGLVETSP